MLYILQRYDTIFQTDLKIKICRNCQKATEKSILILIPHTPSPEKDQKKARETFLWTSYHPTLLIFILKAGWFTEEDLQTWLLHMWFCREAQHSD